MFGRFYFIFSIYLFTTERSEFKAVVGCIEVAKEAHRKREISKVASTEN